MHAHCPDWVYHAFGSKWDPATNSDSREVQRYQRLELEFYKSLDRMIARILNIGGPECLVVLTSDHGAKASTKHFRVADVLEAAGLTVHEGEPPQRRVNWSKTKAVALQAAYIYVNLKGRDPDGSVPPEEYDAVRDEIIKALMECVDPETGRKPIALALKREDARIMGLYGDRVGDVVYALSPHFGGQHGNLLPTCEFSLGSMRSLLVLKGPGVKKGHVLERNVWLTDIVPTMCYLADLPLPAQAEGCIIYQALEDPQAHRKELQELRENYARLKQAYEADVQLTHRYNEPK
jgi:arylsulfatase A-like enzyme